jgi:hypothetical protein
MQTAELHSLLNVMTSADRQRITSEMPVADLHGLLDLAPPDGAIASRPRVDVIAASFVVTFALGLFAWLVAS